MKRVTYATLGYAYQTREGLPIMVVTVVDAALGREAGRQVARMRTAREVARELHHGMTTPDYRAIAERHATAERPAWSWPDK